MLKRLWNTDVIQKDLHLHGIQVKYATYIDLSGETKRDNIFDEETVAADARYGDGKGSGSDTIITHISAGSITGNPESPGPPKFGEVSTYRYD